MQAEQRCAAHWIDSFCARSDDPRVAPATLMVVAHPDDEVIGAGGRLRRLNASVSLVHVTDGSPECMDDALAAGCRTRREYADTRKKELTAALSLAGIRQDQCLALNVTDQEAARNMVEITHRVKTRIEELKPDLILTHPYEGGHPDHDAVAFAVHAACRLLSGFAPCLLEFACYHAGSDGGIRVLEFLPRAEPVTTLWLSPEESLRKREMMECFVTQSRVLKVFPSDRERFRPAPAYDFTRPPHDGPPYYDQFDWGIRSGEWQALARLALLELEPAI